MSQHLLYLSAVSQPAPTHLSLIPTWNLNTVLLTYTFLDDNLTHSYIKWFLLLCAKVEKLKTGICRDELLASSLELSILWPLCYDNHQPSWSCICTQCHVSKMLSGWYVFISHVTSCRVWFGFKNIILSYQMLTNVLMMECMFSGPDKQGLPWRLSYGVKFYIPDPANLKEDYTRLVSLCVWGEEVSLWVCEGGGEPACVRRGGV